MQGASRHSCNLLTVGCSGVFEDKQRQDLQEDRLRYPFPGLTSCGRMEQVQTLTSPSLDEFSRKLEAYRPRFVYLKGQELSDENIGSLSWGDSDLSTPELVAGAFGSVLPSMVYVETPHGEEVAKAIHAKGVPYVIFWKSSFSCYAASHFRHALFSVIQSSSCHPWDAFQLSLASFRFHCIRNNMALPSNSQVEAGDLGPGLLGYQPVIDVVMPDVESAEEDNTNEEDLSTVKIHDEETSVRFLVCGVAGTLDTGLLGCLEDGLNSILNIEMRGSKLHNRFSAPPPPLQAGTFSRGVVTMKCDISTCSSSHISLLVSGSAQTCFDQLLESHIKKEAIERSQLVRAIATVDEQNVHIVEPRTSSSVACGAPVFEICAKVPTWALQILRQLAPDASYRSLVALGIASVQSLSVAAFGEDDAKRLLFFCSKLRKDFGQLNLAVDDCMVPPSWLRSPAPCRKRREPDHESNTFRHGNQWSHNKMITARPDLEDKSSRWANGFSLPKGSSKKKSKVAPMRPIPHTHIRNVMPFSAYIQLDGIAGQAKTTLPVPPPTKPSLGTNSAPYRRSSSNSYQAKQVISLNPIPLKKHACGRAPIQLCSEEEFVKDVMQFLILRGHARLIPQGGLAEFPDAVLNSKRLDLYNLYREVVSRGGFHVGNGINWKGQVFSKMRNFTATNKMTGVGNTLKRHYETYLLEYELAHDDVDGECCLLCHSSAAGDWVNCGVCGEWAHFGCDRRQGLGAFKDYAKTDGLEYICPHCSVSNFKKKLQKPSEAYSEGLTYS